MECYDTPGQLGSTYGFYKLYELCSESREQSKLRKEQSIREIEHELDQLKGKPKSVKRIKNLREIESRLDTISIEHLHKPELKKEVSDAPEVFLGTLGAISAVFIAPILYYDLGSSLAALMCLICGISMMISSLEFKDD